MLATADESCNGRNGPNHHDNATRIPKMQPTSKTQRKTRQHTLRRVFRDLAALMRRWLVVAAGFVRKSISMEATSGDLLLRPTPFSSRMDLRYRFVLSVAACSTYWHPKKGR